MTGRKQYTLVARNSKRKLVIGLPDSSKGQDEDFLVITGNWKNPLLSCPLIPGVPDLVFTVPYSFFLLYLYHTFALTVCSFLFFFRQRFHRKGRDFCGEEDY